MRLIFLLSIYFILSCAISYDNFPYDDYDYSIDSLTLGLAFVPDSNCEYRDFTQKQFSTLNISNVRISQSWNLREPEQDTYYWLPMTERLDFYELIGTSVLLTLDTKEFPDWTTEMTDTEIVAEFKEYVSALLAKYPGQIDIIQLGNEWDWEIDTYLSGDEELFISMNNALYNAVQEAPASTRPEVSLGSISIDGLRFLSFYQKRLENVYFGDTPLYTQEQIESSGALLDAKTARALNIISNSNFDIIDLHFYDDYWNWSTYLDAFEEVLTNSGKNIDDYILIASEFGGPHPNLENNSYNLQAEHLISYIHTLDNLSINKAYYFKLAEGGNSGLIAHPNSYLLDSSLTPNSAYEVFRLFGNY